jgi:hypothetical protein
VRALPQPLPASGTVDGNRGRAQAPAAIPPGPVIEYANSRQEGGLGLAVVGRYVYRGSALAQFGRRYAFGDSSQSFGGPPSGKLLVAKPRMSRLWQLGQLRAATNPTGELGHRVLGFGQNGAGELYVLTTDNVGPSGTTGRSSNSSRRAEGR